MLTSYTRNYQPASCMQPLQEQPIQLDIKDQEWDIRDEALQFQRDGYYVEACKNYITLFDNSISMPSDLKFLMLILYEHINLSSSPIVDFSFAEINSIISACKTVVPHNENDKLKTELLLKHLNSKMSALCEQNENNKYQAMLYQNLDTQNSIVDISRAEPFLTLASIGYPLAFFMPQPEGLESDLQWAIRDLAVKSNNEKGFAKAAKLCIKLLVNAIDKPMDKKFLNEIIYKKITTSDCPIFDFNLNEIQAILFSSKNAKTLNQEEISQNKFLVEHLDFKINHLIKDIERNTRNAKLLIKSFEDKGAVFASLPRELITTIAWLYLNVIANIGQTSVDISRT